MTKRIIISEFPIFVVWNGLKYQNGDSKSYEELSLFLMLKYTDPLFPGPW